MMKATMSTLIQVEVHQEVQTQAELLHFLLVQVLILLLQQIQLEIQHLQTLQDSQIILPGLPHLQILQVLLITRIRVELQHT